MPTTTCGNCRRAGSGRCVRHGGADDFPCQKCQRRAAPHAPGCPKGKGPAAPRTTTAPVVVAAVTTGATPTILTVTDATNDAKTAATVLLTHLYRVRERLLDRIRAVEDLAEML